MCVALKNCQESYDIFFLRLDTVKFYVDVSVNCLNSRKQKVSPLLNCFDVGEILDTCHVKRMNPRYRITSNNSHSRKKCYPKREGNVTIYLFSFGRGN